MARMICRQATSCVQSRWAAKRVARASSDVECMRFLLSFSDLRFFCVSPLRAALAISHAKVTDGIFHVSVEQDVSHRTSSARSLHVVHKEGSGHFTHEKR